MTRESFLMLMNVLEGMSLPASDAYHSTFFAVRRFALPCNLALEHCSPLLSAGGGSQIKRLSFGHSACRIVLAVGCFADDASAFHVHELIC
jgi:hypothetical protein